MKSKILAMMSLMLFTSVFALPVNIFVNTEFPTNIIPGNEYIVIYDLVTSDSSTNSVFIELEMSCIGLGCLDITYDDFNYIDFYLDDIKLNISFIQIDRLKLLTDYFEISPVMKELKIKMQPKINLVPGTYNFELDIKNIGEWENIAINTYVVYDYSIPNFDDETECPLIECIDCPVQFNESYYVGIINDYKNENDNFKLVITTLKKEIKTLELFLVLTFFILGFLTVLLFRYIRRYKKCEESL